MRRVQENEENEENEEEKIVRECGEKTGLARPSPAVKASVYI